MPRNLMMPGIRETAAVCLILACLVLTGCACTSKRCVKHEHDVIPAEWITNDGSRAIQGPPPNASVAYVFPSSHGPIGTCVTFRSGSFLREGNGIRRGGPHRFCIVCGDRCEHEDHPVILMTWQEGTYEVEFTVTEGALVAIRRLDWRCFRHLQRRFQGWVLNASKAGAWEPFRDPRTRFTDEFEPVLRDLWFNVLAKASVEATLSPTIRWPADGSRIADQNFGPAMGAIRLLPGMKLMIHWGGTAIYRSGDSPVWIFRPTVTGATQIDILERGDKHVLGLPPFIASATGQPFWTTTPRPPQWTEHAEHLPFGKGAEGGKHLVPVFNNLDLTHPRALRTGGGTVELAPRLTLLTPHEYIKPDFGLNDNGEPTEPKTRTTDALMDFRDHWRSALARRYMIWGSDESLCWPGDAPTIGIGTNLGDWKYRPLVFANQTSVSVEVPVSIGYSRPSYVPLGYVWSDVIELQSPWELDRAPPRRGMPVMALRRFAPIPRACDRSSVAADSPRPRTYRFYRLEDLQLVDVQPGDILLTGSLSR